MQQPNKKKEILDYIIGEKAKGEQTVSLREFSDQRGWNQESVASKVDQMYPALNSGVTPMVPWLWERKAVEDLYDRWDAEPPEEIEQCSFIDE